MKIGKLEYILLAVAVIVFLISCIVTERSARIAVILGVVEEIIPESPKVALTFDDGPHELYTPKLLEGLKERDVTATFFIIGKNVDGSEEIIKSMQDDGHLIGNHTFSHVQLSKISDDAACAEIWKANTTIFDAIGKIPVYIRPPFGSWTEELTSAVEMQVVMWDVDPMDWKYQNADRIVNHVLSKAADGDIILLHDVYPASVEAALRIVDELKERGFEFVTVEEILLD